MTDQPVRTILETDQGTLSFQEYFVREKWQPAVRRIVYEGAADAAPTPEVSAALESATLVVLGPSNPYLSIDPVLAIPDIGAGLSRKRVPCIAISPIIGGRAVKGPAAKLMAELGHDISPLGVAKHYEDKLKGIILDEVDQTFCPSIEALNIRAVARRTLMESLADKTRLARELLEWAQELAK
jgi:LPPG:FO 2-phospho-L-lactate transferase